MNPRIRSSTFIPGAKVIERDRFEDHRGYFTELYEANDFTQLRVPAVYTQLNMSRSKRGVFRGLHFQWDPPMAKTMWCIHGEVLLVAVDIRMGSPTFGDYMSTVSTGDLKVQLSTPPGFARGFYVFSEYAEVQYLCTACHNPKGEGAIHWSAVPLESLVSIGARTSFSPILSDKDDKAPTIDEWRNSSSALCFQFDPEHPNR